MGFTTSSPVLARALSERNYDTETPVQSAVLAADAQGRDLLVSAQTGSGKTVAFGLAIGETLLQGAETFGPAGAPLALIVAPTRELALQVHRELTWLYSHTQAKIVSCVGGMDPRREQRALAEGAHIVVGTPGRLRDHLERRRLDVSALKALVLDEADEMLDLGFREDLEFILETTPSSRRSLLFSATLPRAITALAKRYQNNALRIEVKNSEGGHADIDYRAVRIAPKEMELVVVNLLRFHEVSSAIVFCNTRETVRHLQAILQERGFSTVALSGELGQSERNQALQALRDGRARVCVATDVAARGIDLPSLGLVIHAELPHDSEGLQHRSGRTGRAGRKGISVVLVPTSQRHKAERLFAGARIAAEWGGPPAAEDIRDRDQARMLEDPLLREPPAEEDIALGQALLAEHPPERLASAFIRLYRSQLPAPEEVTDPGEGPGKRQRASTGFVQEAGRWFRVAVGRSKNADPKWLLPMLCKRGNVTKRDIGAIRIFEHETAVEIATAAADGFAATATRPPEKGEPRIEPMAEAPSGAREPRKTFDKPRDGANPRVRANKKFAAKRVAKKAG